MTRKDAADIIIRLIFCSEMLCAGKCTLECALCPLRVGFEEYDEACNKYFDKEGNLKNEYIVTK